MAPGTEDGPTDPDVTEGFTTVDAQPDPSQLVNAMLATAQWPAVRLLRSWEWDHLDPRPGETALDVGCGVGDVATELAVAVGEGGAVIAIDASDAMLGAARRRAEAMGVDVDFRVGDATAIDLPDDAVDVVRCERVLQWVPEYEGAISEMTRVLRPGGRIVVIDSDWSTARADVGDDEAALAFIDSMMEFRGPPATVGRRLLNLLRQAGLRDVEATATTHLWTTWDPDEPPGGSGLFPMQATVDQLIDLGELDPVLGTRFAAAFVDAGRSDRFFLSVGMVAVGGVQA
ncbi:MAG: methyltransferase domain-containing protein [Acidimicrobiales bacterium]